VDAPPRAADSLAGPATTREHLVRELPSIALVLLATAQIALALGAGLSPWKGGGFGMFATNDHGSFRSVRAFAIGAGGEERIVIPSDRIQQLFRVRELPNRRALRAFARSLATVVPDAAAIRVEVWRARFDAELHASYEKLAAAEWERAP
jgi:hypothetical protein